MEKTTVQYIYHIHATDINATSCPIPPYLNFTISSSQIGGKDYVQYSALCATFEGHKLNTSKYIWRTRPVIVQFLMGHKKLFEI